MKNLPKYKINEMKAISMSTKSIIEASDIIISINRVKPQADDIMKLQITKNLYKG